MRNGTYPMTTLRSRSRTERRYSILSNDGPNDANMEATGNNSHRVGNGGLNKRKHQNNETESKRLFSKNNHCRTCSNLLELDDLVGTRVDERLGEDIDSMRRETERDTFLNRQRSDESIETLDDWSMITWLDVGSAVDTMLFWTFLGITFTSTTVVLTLFFVHSSTDLGLMESSNNTELNHTAV